MVVTRLRASIKRIPFFHRLYLNLATFNRYLRYRVRFNDHCRIKETWDFSTAAEQERHRDALSAVTSNIGPSLGEVLEVGCYRGEFTIRIAPLAAKVLAIDVSEENSAAAKERSARFSNVEVRRVNLLRDPVTGQFDVVFVMCVLQYIKGTMRFRKIADTFSQCLRDGGVLVIQESRLIPEVEGSCWVHWLGEGAFHICDFFERQTGFRLLQKSVHQEYVTAVYRKPLRVPHAHDRQDNFFSRCTKMYRQWRVFVGHSSSADQPLFKRFSDSGKIAESSAHSLLRPKGLAQLQTLTRILDGQDVPGDFVECGVYRGGSALLLGDALKTSPIKRHLWLFDSFQGLPAPTAQDGPSAPYLESTLKSDAAEVAKLLRNHGIAEEQVTITAGWFQETLHKANIDRIALLHIDADWYSSVKQCLNNLYQLVSPGGIVILDDYNDWPGCKIALDEFLRENNLQVKLEGGSEGPCYFRKQQ